MRIELAKLICTLLLMIVTSCANAGENFSAQEVGVNMARYLNVVFGTAPPTLDDYLKFSSIHAEGERVLEERACKKMFGGNRQEREKKCSSYMDYRYKNKGVVKSLYFKLLRHKLRVPPAKLLLGKLEAQSDGGYCMNVSVRETGTLITICHAATQTLAELGLVGIVKINGNATEQFLGITN